MVRKNFGHAKTGKDSCFYEYNQTQNQKSGFRRTCACKLFDEMPKRNIKFKCGTDVCQFFVVAEAFDANKYLKKVGLGKEDHHFWKQVGKAQLCTYALFGAAVHVRAVRSCVAVQRDVPARLVDAEATAQGRERAGTPLRAQEVSVPGR
ncbi:hypothetical protein RJ640_015290 [Escallonia rubra]|uniref:Uncharacterized protein n=1 Tax=Escallonia rubra TaxID=112253 RepID=A0AA88QQ59_9ASTE|nr:hypothetical protein RJ640_015290 [Escallonia rubra]